MKGQLFLTLILLILLSCSIKTRKNLEDPQESIIKREKASGEKSNAHLGKFLGKISFEVKTKDTIGFKNGLIPWASLEKPEQDISGLKNASEILINQPGVTVVIDYPLKNGYRFELNSNNGFSRELLLKEISKAYYKMYEEEEATATIKTIPVEKRTTMYNRNETNGKYGIWGHDIADLVLSEIHVYEDSDKKLILALMIES
ncbi:hypothetical protein SAMN04487898_109189 [Pedobacter sp. ok626]|uniref:hypothetical protein n=1 Tax=Pedobacter sp. ok626 TaxID=1761882 RepID=UPI000885B031|nr:hypothetical protein [Pedobacter sp. ok626]SDK58211.1 hypothetical protein SAMN04487898_109189 [Pedobacter sp. ok626]